MTSVGRGPLPWSFGPWIWGPRVDLALFAGSAGLALLLVGLGRVARGWRNGELSDFWWVVLVLCVDVAHVYSTLFRTYFDRAELRARPLRYYGLPPAVYALGVALYQVDTLLFWRALAYAALFHFVRQQAGWVAVYRARAGQRARLDVFLDSATVYLGTLYPVLHWHVHLEEKNFAWLTAGDFVALEIARAWLPFLGLALVCSLVAFLLRQALLAWKTRVVHAGKTLVVVTTVTLWCVGIVFTNSDFEFTVTNVLAHGLPYLGLLWFYARHRQKEDRASFGAGLVARGVVVFVSVLALLAFVEEALWDRFVWHERAWLFGDGSVLSSGALAVIVPLLALPQALHYALDGLLWRRSETARLPAQRAALGFYSTGPS